MVLSNDMYLQNLNEKNELKNCAFVKTVLMLLVVLDHSAAFWTGDWFTKDPVFLAKGLAILSKYLNTVHIRGFSLVSGYIFYYVKYEKDGYRKFTAFAANKAKRLLIPYLFAAVVWVIPIQQMFLHTEAGLLVKNYLLGINPSQLWFLLMLFCVFIIFYPLSDFFKKHNILGAFVAVGLCGVGMFGSLIVPNVFRFLTAMQYVTVFWIGFKMRQYGTHFIRKIPAAIWLLASIALFMLIQYLDGIDSTSIRLLTLGIKNIAYIVGAVMAFVVLQNIADRCKWDGRAFNFISRRSMTVYLFHQQIIYFSVYWLNGVINPYLNAAVNFVCAMGISLLIATALMQFRVTRTLIGEK